MKRRSFNRRSSIFSLPLLFSLAVLCTGAVGCTEDPGEITVQNLIHGAVIKDVRWGDLFLAGELLPGEKSAKQRVHDANEASYGVDLPAAYPIKFYMEVQGDRLYLQTRELYSLDTQIKTDVILSDTTQVYNPVLEAE